MGGWFVATSFHYFFIFKETNKDIAKMIMQFAEDRASRKLRPSTLEARRKDWMSWFRFLGIKQKIPPIKLPPVPDPRIPSVDDFLKLRKVAMNQPDKGRALRDRLIIDIFGFAGIRENWFT